MSQIIRKAIPTALPQSRSATALPPLLKGIACYAS